MGLLIKWVAPRRRYLDRLPEIDKHLYRGEEIGAGLDLLFSPSSRYHTLDGNQDGPPLSHQGPNLTGQHQKSSLDLEHYKARPGNGHGWAAAHGQQLGDRW